VNEELLAAHIDLWISEQFSKGGEQMSDLMTWTGFAGIVLAATATLAADPPAAESVAKKKDRHPRISSTIEINSAAAISAKEADEISFAAGRILKHVVQARHALADRKKDEASCHVDQGIKLIAIIDHVLPHSKVKTEIKSGDHTYVDEDDVTPRYLTIFDELERRDIISPIVQAKKEVEQSKPAAQASSSEAKGTNVPIAVSHADIVYSTAKLDIELTRRALSQAKRSLEADNFEQADKALLTLQSQGVLFEFAEIDLPLTQVAENLKLAEIELKAGRHDEAKAALHVAMDELKQYEKLVGDKRGIEVKTLHHEIDKLASELDKGPLSETERQKLVAKISEWWHTATTWMRSRSK
jgi:hypothetical protein